MIINNIIFSFIIYLFYIKNTISQSIIKLKFYSINNYLITNSLSIGTPPQNFKLLISNRANYCLIPRNNLSFYFQETFNSYKSETFNINNYYEGNFSIGNLTYKGIVARDVIFKDTFLTFILINDLKNNSNFLSKEFNGILSIKKTMNPYFNLVYTLYHNNKINEPVIYFYYINNKEGEIIFGENINIDNKYVLNKKFNCFSGPDYNFDIHPELGDLFYCSFDNFYLINNKDNKTEIEINKDIQNYILFDIGSRIIEIPYEIGINIFNNFINLSNGLCDFINNKTNILCNENFNISELSNLQFYFNEEKYFLNINSKDLFEMNSEKKFFSKIKLSTKYKNVFLLGEPFIKNYFIKIDYKNNKISILDDLSYLHKNDDKKNIKNYHSIKIKKYFFIIICLILLIVICLSILLYLNIKKLNNKNKKNILLEFNEF